MKKLCKLPVVVFAIQYRFSSGGSLCLCMCVFGVVCFTSVWKSWCCLYVWELESSLTPAILCRLRVERSCLKFVGNGFQWLVFLYFFVVFSGVRLGREIKRDRELLSILESLVSVTDGSPHGARESVHQTGIRGSASLQSVEFVCAETNWRSCVAGCCFVMEILVW